jgi:predicted transcriptional regulator
MPNDDQLTLDRRVSAEIVGAYLRNHQVSADQLASLISTVHQALANLGKPATETPGERKPAVSVRQSVQRDYVVCMDCGWKGSMLRRHITAAHGLTADEYRARWNLPATHAMTAPAYSERRATMAKQFGLGRIRGASAKTMAVAETETTAAAQPGPKRRRGSRSAAATPA